MTYQVSDAAITQFVDTVRGKGYVDVRDYNQFLRSLDTSNAVFDVTLERYKKVIEPTYTNPNNFGTFQQTFTVRYDGYFTKEILSTLYPSAQLADDDASRRYTMHVGDLFNVRIQSRGITLAGRLRSFLFRGQAVPIAIKKGGMVRSEAP
ncbi:hypothetical protein GCM10008018_72340 [Paenibacillus marchantiophytorum]|uniref:Uncharacterized protein n=1 Tax=Paenibacillus marchantiophytorum TaxID=1619310 RepID=A0ABQ1FKW2_9BACL|nr:hypothetical protein [Paenibacillus marchantiophytorum]GGA17740.1 hypothetical protein GCM10008018_72340 [Paenibacillus marchantiophytorum]